MQGRPAVKAPYTTTGPCWTSGLWTTADPHVSRRGQSIPCAYYSPPWLSSCTWPKTDDGTAIVRSHRNGTWTKTCALARRGITYRLAILSRRTRRGQALYWTSDLPGLMGHGSASDWQSHDGKANRARGCALRPVKPRRRFNARVAIPGVRNNLLEPVSISTTATPSGRGRQGTFWSEAPGNKWETGWRCFAGDGAQRRTTVSAECSRQIINSFPNGRGRETSSRLIRGGLGAVISRLSSACAGRSSRTARW